MDRTADRTADDHWTRHYFNLRALPFWFVHGAAIAGVALMGWSWSGVGLAIALYYARMFFVTASYHRYFAHRSYKTSRPFQFLLALFGTLAVQKGPLWWAGHHRQHHKAADTLADPHSPRHHGLLWAHVGWIVSRRHNASRLDGIRDFARYPELRWLNKYHLVPVVLYAVTLLLTLGWWGFVWGFLVSTVLLWHGTFTINSLTHVFGKRRFASGDDSLNSLPLALLTMGEGWHNNHHFYQSSVNQGFYWWEVDLSYYVLRALQCVGLVWDLRKPPAWVLDQAR